jgi:hypothetical protein
MARYRIRVEGRNLVLASQPDALRSGFVTTRMIEASSAEEAGEQAMQAIWDDAGLRGQLANDEEDPPLLYLSEVEETPAGDSIPPDELGYAFFEEPELDITVLLGNPED